MSGIEDALRDRADNDDSIREPYITVVVTVEEDVDFQEAQLKLGEIRRNVENQLTSRSPSVDVDADYTVNSFGAETISGMEWSDLKKIKVSLEGAVADAGYSLAGTSVMDETRRPSF